VVLLSKVEAAFTVPGRGLVIVLAAITTTVHIGDAIQLRTASGNVIDEHIVEISLVKQRSGPCRVAFLLSKDVTKADVTPEAEIWVAISK
jgi:hypothetical protein